ncbi:50S ribosomal protein L31 [candidate division WWE3 bacterium RIFCSPLOWO2_01_FULL_39_13]|uniref:Large ribosomal subunit protein bL31 n=1 Tax=candidate division WWE3 bacterium RIFCSPLOWO2_01_FULL_39_13 TaxID=1802624 RepID=A0A1F4V2N5_UNCKA|nr:MAG: 50S ribosomal protein L31 [candidate division WWE3 bacterium RIFCSPLOWO2_01_FULL_39_13]
MKKDIHPKYYTDCSVTCACGNQFTTGSTAKEIRVEICSKCHPFWTGEQKFVDIEGRVDKFKKRVDLGEKERKKRVKKIKEKIERQKERENAPRSLRDMLKSMQ